MIAVIADDLTGAAEIGGIGLSRGLSVEVALEVNPLSTADLLIISTDTRSKTESEAVAEIEAVSKKIAALKPRLIFKKVDSALRGHIIPEIEAQLKIFGNRKALVVAANPALGRTIVNGQYLIHGKPLDQTAFKDDPEFPAKSSQVVELLPAKNLPIIVKKHGDQLADNQIAVGEVSHTTDLKKWTGCVGENMLLAGGSGFFSAILDSLEPLPTSEPVAAQPFKGNKLYVCGTAFVSSQLRVAAISNQKGLVNYLPENLFLSDELTLSVVESFVLEVSQKLSQQGAAVIAINPLTRNGKNINAISLREKTALLVQDVFQKAQIDEMVIEGGSTATAIFNALNIKTLFPTNEYAPGVIRCRAGEIENLYITLKPGSYSWPKEVWIF
ncbi:four-carbon acid sugar kinase family protein [Paradesertivirga mongoliensis]|uniref:Four-carbon acid sugar kinase family protein n=1 Tax=Paradesertivirga mongoliensis TaxID=2100740 RepID=A0ABW4ZQH0_9SPHI|nr:four-carbon acid sugar kinase family protein [Pedobacter mongoliensis]